MDEPLAKKVIFLIFVLLVLGGLFIFAKVQNDDVGVSPSPSSSAEPSQSKAPSAAAIAEAEKVRILLAADPGPNGTEKQRYDYSLQVAQAAKYDNVLDVSMCMPVPGVVHVTMGQATVISNSDAERHSLSHFGGTTGLDIAGNSNKSFTIAFSKPGIFPYQCDGKVAGIFFVTPK